MITIPFPQAPKVISQKDNEATFVIEGLFPGYGVTVANALRRVILSSLPGAGVIAVKIKDVDHEFSTIPGIMEDVVNIILNIKKMRFRMHESGVFEGTLKVKGEQEVKAGHFKLASELSIVNPDLHIATLSDKKAELEITIWVTEGIGYELAEEHTIKAPVQGVGVLKVDTIFTPVISTSFDVELMRVGDRTDYNRIVFKVQTDGTISPQEAFDKTIQTLIGQFQALQESQAIMTEVTAKEGIDAEEEERELAQVAGKSDMKDSSLSSRYFITHLKLSSRIEKILKKHRIKTIGQLVQKNEEELMKMDGIGEAAVKEIRRKLGKAGFLLGGK